MDTEAKAARKRALDAALETDGRTQEAETREYLREIVDVVLTAVGYDALRAERDRHALEAQSLRERRDAADRVHSATMRAWAETDAERNRYEVIVTEVEGLIAAFQEDIPGAVSRILAERDRLHRVVATYGEHTGDCPAYDEDDMSPECECGWSHACVRSFEFAGRESLDQDDAAEG